MLDRGLGLEPTHVGVLSEALAAAGRHPGDYSSQPAYHLERDQRTDTTVKEILLAILEANIKGAKADLDSEFLHDLRVATRRTRSALTQIKGVFPPDLVADYKARFPRSSGSQARCATWTSICWILTPTRRVYLSPCGSVSSPCGNS